MKKFLALILLAVMLLTTLVACAEGGKEETVTTDPQESVTEPEEGNGPVEEKPFDATEMRDKNLASEKVMNVLCWNSEHPEFEILETEIGGDSVNAAIFERNNQVMRTLGFSEIIWTEQVATAGNETKFLKYVETVAQNGDVPIDVIASYARSTALCSQKGFLAPLNFYDKHIDLTHTWYPQSLLDEITIGGNVYFLSGDISTNLLFVTYGCIFNKDILTDIGVDYNYLYELVDKGKWTLDEMFTLTGEYYHDVDGDGKKSVKDAIGLRTQSLHVDSIYTGAGLKYAEIDNNATDSEKLVIISPDFSSKKSIDLNDRLGEIFASDYAINDGSCAKNFAVQANSIMLISRIRDIRELFKEGVDEMDYGVLPLPKYDESQEDYKCVAANPFTLWGVYSGNYDLDSEECAAAFIEWSGYYGMYNTTEAIFEYLFKGRYAEEPDDAASFDIIRRTTSFDIGRIFAVVISPDSIMADRWSACATKGSKWATIYSTLIRGYSDNAKKASKDFWNLKETMKNPYEVSYDN
jgi:ABC-type glycerol-3-phosphate transport system substrate-binding protein